MRMRKIMMMSIEDDHIDKCEVLFWPFLLASRNVAQKFGFFLVDLIANPV